MEAGEPCWQDGEVAARDWTAVAGAAQAALDDLEQVMHVVAGAIRDSVPAYALVPDDELTKTLLPNVRAVLLALRDRRHLQPGELAGFTATVEQRARDGVAIDDYLSGIAVGEVGIWEQVALRTKGTPDDALAEATAIRLACIKAIFRVTAAAHRRIELAAVRADQERRAQALRMLLRGGLEREHAGEQLSRLGLQEAADWYVVHARAQPGIDAERALEAPEAAYVLLGQDTVGLVRHRPTPCHGVTVAVAGPVALAELAEANRQAAVLLATAWAMGRQGVSDLNSLGLAVAVQAVPEMGQQMRQRFLDPVRDAGGLGDELLNTVRAYLESGGRRDLAAERLHMHQNTVSYRLNRFCELTGADLSDLPTLAALHWLFVDLDLRPG